LKKQKEVKVLYSPKIREDLIPILYRIKEAKRGKPMTKIVDEILRPALIKLNEELVKYKLNDRKER